MVISCYGGVSSNSDNRSQCITSIMKINKHQKKQKYKLNGDQDTGVSWTWKWIFKNWVLGWMEFFRPATIMRSGNNIKFSAQLL